MPNLKAIYTQPNKLFLVILVLFINNIFNMNNEAANFWDSILDSNSNDQNAEQNFDHFYYTKYSNQEYVKEYLIDEPGTDITISLWDEELGRTPLIWACINRDEKRAGELIDAGISLYITDIYGKSAIDYAIEDFNLNIINLFRYALIVDLKRKMNSEKKQNIIYTCKYCGYYSNQLSIINIHIIDHFAYNYRSKRCGCPNCPFPTKCPSGYLISPKKDYYPNK